ncbi:DUF6221 family protein [Geodermatophilus sp. DSM 45219]|uniref:DUF6221 family protein n=1 Tax=Geodermatophilus sp. DSM 45219 TaxID=1881103 RepID=UPI00088A17A3|nr:DUF6221 family protein [Geodermatophilus sp. DSM 45219]SDN79602.1 hypothetical protein SAMN05428965_1662 [Geodermatophilus sp. DSM 45219]
MTLRDTDTLAQFLHDRLMGELRTIALNPIARGGVYPGIEAVDQRRAHLADIDARFRLLEATFTEDFSNEAEWVVLTHLAAKYDTHPEFREEWQI